MNDWKVVLNIIFNDCFSIYIYWWRVRCIYWENDEVKKCYLIYLGGVWLCCIKKLSWRNGIKNMYGICLYKWKFIVNLIFLLLKEEKEVIYMM